MRLNKIKELLKEIKELSYREYISLLVLNEKIDYNSDIQDITNGDLDWIETGLKILIWKTILVYIVRRLMIL